MGRERAEARGVVLTEDKRTARFVRHLLGACGFNKRKFRFVMAPKGKGAAEAWVRVRYPDEVRFLRSKAYQRPLCLLVFRDGDAVGVEARKAQLDEALRQAKLAQRGAAERIATPVPTWAIENWIFDLLGHSSVNEERKPMSEGPTWKQVFEREHANDEKEALVEAVKHWGAASSRLPSLADGVVEFARIE